MMRKLLFHKLVGKRPSLVGGREAADGGRKVIDDHKYQHEHEDEHKNGSWHIAGGDVGDEDEKAAMGVRARKLFFWRWVVLSEAPLYFSRWEVCKKKSYYTTLGCGLGMVWFVVCERVDWNHLLTCGISVSDWSLFLDASSRWDAKTKGKAWKAEQPRYCVIWMCFVMQYQLCWNIGSLVGNVLGVFRNLYSTKYLMFVLEGEMYQNVARSGKQSFFWSSLSIVCIVIQGVSPNSLTFDREQRSTHMYARIGRQILWQVWRGICTKRGGRGAVNTAAYRRGFGGVSETSCESLFTAVRELCMEWFTVSSRC